MVSRGPAVHREWIVFLVVCILPCFVQGSELATAKPEEVGVSSEKIEELSKFMQSLVDDGKIAGGVTMMARHGKVIHLKAVGMADREEKKPMTTDAIFRLVGLSVFSASQVVVWWGGAMLNGRGLHAILSDAVEWGADQRSPTSPGGYNQDDDDESDWNFERRRFMGTWLRNQGKYRESSRSAKRIL